MQIRNPIFGPQNSQIRNVYTLDECKQIQKAQYIDFHSNPKHFL